MSRITMEIALNGTDVNPFEKMGLTQNPFPQVGKAEYMAGQRQVAKLGGPPIPQDSAEKYIRKTLQGCSEELITLCVKNYRPGEYVKFRIHWEER